MSFQSGSQRKSLHSSLCVVILLFILSIFIRLPNLNRPISKHYEFNSAVILINIISWRQAGGGDQFHYTPVMNFQNAGDKYISNVLGFDKNGNTIYLSFGPGWYVIPYFFYQLLHLPAIPIYLEILNLLFHLATTIIFLYFLELLIPSSQPNKYFMVIAGCCFMIFSPGILWFMGNGYVNTGIMLPFILGVLILILPMFLDSDRIRTGRLLLLGILIMILVYIDWFILFFGFLSCLLAFSKFRQNKKYGWLIGVLLLSISSAVALIFFTFVSHVGREEVIRYWLIRSSERKLHLFESIIFKKIAYLLIYFLTSYLPLIVLLIAGYLKNRSKSIFSEWSKMEILFFKLFGGSLIFYNLFFFNWSAEHEFTILPWSLLLSFLTARYIGTFKNPKMARGLLVLFGICAVVQYYFINRPGSVSRDGTPYASFKNLGESLKKIPKEYTICLKMEQNPMIEYYAGRNILRVYDSLSVKKALQEIGIKKAVWITQKDYQLMNIQIIQ